MAGGDLTASERNLLSIITDLIRPHAPAYIVATWRGRSALVGDPLGDGRQVFMAQANTATFGSLADKDRIKIAAEHTRLPDVRGLPTSGGRSQRRLPRDQSARRITLTEQTGDTHA